PGESTGETTTTRGTRTWRTNQRARAIVGSGVEWHRWGDRPRSACLRLRLNAIPRMVAPRGEPRKRRRGARAASGGARARTASGLRPARRRPILPVADPSRFQQPGSLLHDEAVLLTP